MCRNRIQDICVWGEILCKFEKEKRGERRGKEMGKANKKKPNPKYEINVKAKCNPSEALHQLLNGIRIQGIVKATGMITRELNFLPL